LFPPKHIDPLWGISQKLLWEAPKRRRVKTPQKGIKRFLTKNLKPTNSGKKFWKRPRGVSPQKGGKTPFVTPKETPLMGVSLKPKRGTTGEKRLVKTNKEERPKKTKIGGFKWENSKSETQWKEAPIKEG